MKHCDVLMSYNRTKIQHSNSCINIKRSKISISSVKKGYLSFTKMICPYTIKFFFYKHTVNFQSSSICLAFIQFEPKNMLNPMLNKEIV